MSFKLYLVTKTRKDKTIVSLNSSSFEDSLLINYNYLLSLAVEKHGKNQKIEEYSNSIRVPRA